MKSCSQNSVPVGSNLASLSTGLILYQELPQLGKKPLLLGTKSDDASYLHFTVLVEGWNALRTLKSFE